MNSFIIVIIASLCGLAHALYLPTVAGDSQTSHGPGVRNPRLHVVGMRHQQDDVVNFQDTVYATNMTIGGHNVLIQLDSGSSDLWVNVSSGQIEFSNVTNITTSQSYGLGSVTGPLTFANVAIGPHFVPNQAFINATNTTSFGTIFGDGVSGILGLAADAGSAVDIAATQKFGTGTTLGLTFMSNLFLQNADMQHMFTVQLGRSDDPDYTVEGDFTIGEYLPEYISVANQPQLPRYPNPDVNDAAPRWSAIMSGMTVNGQPFAFNKSGVPGVPEGSIVTVFDTGFSFPPLPTAAVNFIYSSIPGATYDNSTGLWLVPCESSTRLEFQFGNMSVPIHPLDITTVTQLNNKTVCVNTYRPSTLPVNDQFDAILGDAFLKNVYASFNYGAWSAQNPEAIPYIQLLPTTNLTTAFAEFSQVRSQMVASAEASASMTATPAATTSTPAVAAAPTSNPMFASAWSSSPATSELPVNAPPTPQGFATAAAPPYFPSPPTVSPGSHMAGSGIQPGQFPSNSEPALQPPPGGSGQQAMIAPATNGKSAPVPLHRRATRMVVECVGPVVEQYGAMFFAVLCGSLIVSLILCIVTVMLAIRNHRRIAKQRSSAYSVLEAKARSEADPEADVLSASYYYYHDDC
ncbi:uncharacterized protein FIBRA_00606 [Fibroporia radiculosa]|uniref:Peptidase A1 domain-containing protein n=1 Tax=Fibroporia radiculosa TaxID=599839 RepID=J4H0B6_9APHY|nr:uncharacterized protein FIBRA_00606 [Fibroporia radiculosa]CCL98604.1 predicted protein [Fibroporia radiculosa]